MREEMIRKLRGELEEGITSERQVVYVLAEIRKLIEGEGLKKKYPDLKFHCDWSLHPALDGAGAKALLAQFDEAQPLFKAQMHVHDFPPELKREIRRISQMESFYEELTQFLKDLGLPPLTLHRSDGWIHFLHLYTRVIENIPLISANTTTQNVSKVTVHFEAAKETVKHEYGEEIIFKVTWRIFDKNGDSGDFFVINSFSI